MTRLAEEGQERWEWNLPAGYTPDDSERWVPEIHPFQDRTPFERDRARVLHSSALRRLGAKTQVMNPDTDDFVRTRLTHSLEVAQVGREVGRMLGCDPDVVDTACLSHDLGHPPFGHNGERALNKLAAHMGGFEGNAQTLRLLSRLEPKVIAEHDVSAGLSRLEPKVIAEHDVSAGLNLTRASLDATCKYPWTRTDAPRRADGTQTHKFGVYEDDLPVFEWFREGAHDAGVEPQRKCLEAQVMDLADDISYSVHDVEDAVFGGHVQLEQLRETKHRQAVFDMTRQWYLPDATDEQLDSALCRLETLNRWVPCMTGSRASLAQFKGLTSKLIGRFAWSAVEATRERYGRNAFRLERRGGNPRTLRAKHPANPLQRRTDRTGRYPRRNRRHEGDRNRIRYDGARRPTPLRTPARNTGHPRRSALRRFPARKPAIHRQHLQNGLRTAGGS